MEKTAVVVRDLRKEYILPKKQIKRFRITNKKMVAVNNVSFHADYGEIFCLLGANGAGKTTTLRMIANLIEPNGGEIVFDNDKRQSKQSIKSKIAYMTTELNIDKSSSAQYLFNYYGKMYGMTEAEIERRRAYLFSELGIEIYADKRIRELSIGTQRKVSIALSLVNDPGIIIFDEPTKGLDMVTTMEVIEFLKRQRELGKCIILSTHFVDDVRA